MTDELKTLKDFEAIGPSGYYENDIANKEELRAEAVKRIKTCDIVISYLGINLKCGETGRCISCQRDMWVHNLTEEDLQ